MAQIIHRYLYLSIFYYSVSYKSKNHNHGMPNPDKAKLAKSHKGTKTLRNDVY